MAEFTLRSDLIERLNAIARLEGRPVDEIIERLLEGYTTKPSAGHPLPDPETLMQEFRAKAYAIARDHWRRIGDQERLALSDDDLDKDFWLIDSSGIPRLKSERGQIDLAPDPLDQFEALFDSDADDASTTVRGAVAEYFRNKDDLAD
jgi:hypothetical protein